MTSVSATSKQRLVRVFISSTFRDMQEERDYLVKFTFPELKRRCRERQVEFIEVDLRWGITEEQSERGEVLPICLAEIENCRPYFIGLLGERYGYVPDKINPELIERLTWLAEHRGYSITELEIMHGALNNPNMKGRIYFYFRDPSYNDRVPFEKKSDFMTEDSAAKGKLDALKARIRQSGLHLKENYPSPEELGKLVLDDLWNAIDTEFPAGSELSPLDREAAVHEEFAKSRARVYIGREEYYRRLNEYVNGDGPPLVLVGESGSGKSALLANWSIKYRAAHNDNFIILHFVGSSVRSTDYMAIITRIMGEIKRRYDIPDEIPSTSDKMREDFPRWLAIASANGGIILVLDALNQLEDKDNAPDLGWLPAHFPPNVRVILSSLPGRSLIALEKRGYPTFTVRGFNKDERAQFTTEYLKQFSRSLDKAFIDRIVAAGQTENPLFLRALLDELRVFGIYKKLDERIGYYLMAPDVPSLFERILIRLEEDYEKDRPGLVRDALSLLWAARYGLSENELRDVLGSGGPLPRAYWSPLYLALQESLVNRSGLLGFYHDYLQQAVKHHYLPNEVDENAQHKRLATYFWDRPLDNRKVDELPWQLSKAAADKQNWERLVTCLVDPPMFLKLMSEAKRYELIGYWLMLQDKYNMAEAYAPSIDAYSKKASSEDLAKLVYAVGDFLHINAKYDEAESFYRQALTIREKVLGPEHPDTARTLDSLATLYLIKGNFNEAEQMYQQVLRIIEKAQGPMHLEMIPLSNNLGALFVEKGDFDKAEQMHRQAIKICEETLGSEHPETAISLANLAMMLFRKGDYASAEPLYRRSINISEKVLGPEHPQTATTLNDLAYLLSYNGIFIAAEPLCRQGLKIREKVLGPEHPATAKSLNDLATILTGKRELNSAEQMFKRAITIREKVLGPEHPETATSYNGLAHVLYMKGDLKGAEQMYRRAIGIYEKSLGPEHPDTAIVVGNLAKMLMSKGDLKESKLLFRRSLSVFDRIYGKTNSTGVGFRLQLYSVYISYIISTTILTSIILFVVFIITWYVIRPALHFFRFETSLEIIAILLIIVGLFAIIYRTFRFIWSYK